MLIQTCKNYPYPYLFSKLQSLSYSYLHAALFSSVYQNVILYPIQYNSKFNLVEYDI